MSDMVTIREQDLIESVADALQYISYYHSPDFIQAMAGAYEREASPAAKDAIKQILVNSRMCAQGHRPICQDTGIVTVFAKVGMNVRWEASMSLSEMINEGVRRGYDFADNRVPGLQDHEEPAYWRDVGTVDAYWEANIDLTTVLPHLDLYDRFGCPGGHVQAAFRCLVRFGPIDPKEPDALSGRVHTCWINPDAQPSEPGAEASSPAANPAPATPPPPKPAPAPPWPRPPPRTPARAGPGPADHRGRIGAAFKAGVVDESFLGYVELAPQSPI